MSKILEIYEYTLGIHKEVLVSAFSVEKTEN